MYYNYTDPIMYFNLWKIELSRKYFDSAVFQVFSMWNTAIYATEREGEEDSELTEVREECLWELPHPHHPRGILSATLRRGR